MSNVFDRETLSASALEKCLDHAQGFQDWKWRKAAARILPEYGINTIGRVAMFFAQVGHESADGRYLEENLNYTSEEALNTVFTKYFVGDKGQPLRDAAEYTNNPQALANYVYAGRMGNGDEESGDGWRFRGAGLIQLTGRENHMAFARSADTTLDELEEYLRTPEGALESACWYWHNNDLNTHADAWDIEEATRTINGGLNGIHDRIVRWDANLHNMRQAVRPEHGIGFRPANNTRIYRIGDTGPGVEEIQRALGQNVDGRFGERTRFAVRSFQEDNDLTVDGIVGMRTLALMRRQYLGLQYERNIS